MGLEETGVVYHISQTDKLAFFLDGEEVREVGNGVASLTVTEGFGVVTSPVRFCLISANADEETGVLCRGEQVAVRGIGQDTVGTGDLGKTTFGSEERVIIGCRNRQDGCYP